MENEGVAVDWGDAAAEEEKEEAEDGAFRSCTREA